MWYDEVFLNCKYSIKTNKGWECNHPKSSNRKCLSNCCPKKTNISFFKRVYYYVVKICTEKLQAN